jgi:hypothetical protein
VHVEGGQVIELYHAVNDMDSAKARRRVTELGLVQVTFRNIHYLEVADDLRARGGSGRVPALWDGARLHEGIGAVLARLDRGF